jgi:hypothetical protein
VASIYLKIIGFAVGLASGGRAFGQAAENGLDQRHSELLARDDLQFSFTPPEEIPLREPAQPQPSLFGWLDNLLDAIAPVFTWIFWGAVVLAAAALVWFLGREAWAVRFGWQKKAADKTQDQMTDFRPEPARARALLEEADRLAALGQYDEAAHTLLYRSIADIEERAPQAIRKAQTAREIARLPVLPEAVRAAFAPITRAVEQSWFGGRKLDAEIYQACRKAYADFALPASWGQMERRA